MIITNFHFDKMKNIVLADGDWGGCHLSVDFNKIDLLPQVCLKNVLGNTHFCIAFLMLNFELVFFGSEMKAFLRKLKSGELKKEMDEMAEQMKPQIHTLDEIKEKQKEDDNIKHISEVLEEIKAELKEQRDAKPRKRKRIAEQ